MCLHARCASDDRTENLLLRIWNAGGAVVTAMPVATTFLPASAITRTPEGGPEFVFVDILQLAVQVTAGVQYGFSLTGSSPWPVGHEWSGGSQFTTYAGGAANFWLVEGRPPEIASYDLGFRTYVERVPEPGTLLPIATGGMAIVRRSRRR